MYKNYKMNNCCSLAHRNPRSFRRSRVRFFDCDKFQFFGKPLSRSFAIQSKGSRLLFKHNFVCSFKHSYAMPSLRYYSIKKSINTSYLTMRKQYFEKGYNKNNMLHPDLLHFVRDRRVRELIILYENEKYIDRQGGKLIGKGGDWGSLPNRLHNNKVFIGLDCRKNIKLYKAQQQFKFPGTVYGYTADWIIARQGLEEPEMSIDRFVGIYCGEGSSKVCLGKRGINIDCAISISQNHRNFQILTGAIALFGTGCLGCRSVWNNKSGYNWTCRSLNGLYNNVLPILKKTDFHTIKQAELSLLVRRINSWKAKINRKDIV